MHPSRVMNIRFFMVNFLRSSGTWELHSSQMRVLRDP